MQAQVPALLLERNANIKKLLGKTEAIEILINDEYVVSLGKKKYKLLKTNLMALKEEAFRRGLCTTEYYNECINQWCLKIAKTETETETINR